MQQPQHTRRRAAPQQRRAPPPPKDVAETLENRLLALVERTGYEMVQENGQRRYGGPPPLWHGPPPPPEAELYVARIPQLCFEVFFFNPLSN